MVNIYKYLEHNKLKTRMLCIVHDELVIAMHKDELEHAAILRWLLSDFDSFRCPITAGVEVGNPSWGEKVIPTDVGFTEPADKAYLEHDVYDGAVFDIYRKD
jgi:hypothetical protein